MSQKFDIIADDVVKLMKARCLDYKLFKLAELINPAEDLGKPYLEFEELRDSLLIKGYRIYPEKPGEYIRVIGIDSRLGILINALNNTTPTNQPGCQDQKLVDAIYEFQS